MVPTTIQTRTYCTGYGSTPIHLHCPVTHETGRTAYYSCAAKLTFKNQDLMNYKWFPYRVTVNQPFYVPVDDWVSPASLPSPPTPTSHKRPSSPVYQLPGHHLHPLHHLSPSKCRNSPPLLLFHLHLLTLPGSSVASLQDMHGHV